MKFISKFGSFVKLYGQGKPYLEFIRQATVLPGSFQLQNGVKKFQIQPSHAFCISTAFNKSKVWSLGKINHIAVVTPDLDKSTSIYRDVLGGKVSEKQFLPDHGVKVVFVELGDTKLELLNPLGESSPIQSFLNKNKSGGMHHICIEVDNIMAAMEDLKEKNIRLLSDKPKIGAHGNPVVFLHPKDCDGVLVELEEVKSAQ